MNTAVYSVTHDNKLPLVTDKNINILMCVRTSIEDTIVTVCTVLIIPN